MEGLTIRLMKAEDVEVLHKICCEAYSENFSHHWEDGGLESYVENVFGKSVIKNELADANIQYYTAFIIGEPVGFMRLNLNKNLDGIDNERGMELDKVYILPEYKKMKIGKMLLKLAFGIAGEKKKEIFWLGVIDTNNEAISFYERNGFKFHSKTELDYPKFKKELKGMWRMYFELAKEKNKQ